MNHTIALEIKNVTKRFPGVLALDDVSMQLRKGEILGLCGENGAGKSTLLKILSGVYPQGTYDGSVCLNGKEAAFKNPLDAEKAGIATIYQEISLIENMSVADNIMIGKYRTKKGMIDEIDKVTRAREAMNKVHLDLDPNRSILGLNTGKRQLIAIAKALVEQPNVMLLDESTSALTDSEISELFRIIRSLKASGISCIYISHKMDEIFELCDRIVVMRDGRVVRDFEREEFDESQILECMVGRSFEMMYEKTNQAGTEIALEVEHLSTRTAAEVSSTQVKDVSFQLRRGEILGFAGLVGSGRSETVNAIFGAIRKSKDSVVKIDGKEIDIQSPLDAIQHDIALLTEDRKASGLILGLPIRENLLLASLRKQFRGIFINKHRETQMAEHYKERLKIKAPTVSTVVGTLSGGNQQKVIFAKWMLTKPKIIFLDEPTRGIDVGAKREIYSIINQMANEGVSIVFISSEMPELIGMCDRILVFREGEIVDNIPRCEATQMRIIAAAAGTNS